MCVLRFRGHFFFGDAEIIKERNVYFEPFCWISYTMVRRILCYKSLNQPRGHRDKFYLFFFFSWKIILRYAKQCSSYIINLLSCFIAYLTLDLLFSKNLRYDFYRICEIHNVISIFTQFIQQHSRGKLVINYKCMLFFDFPSRKLWT